jgi:hypothetical protein
MIDKLHYLNCDFYIHRKIIYSIDIQSNLCTTASLGTQKNWPLFKSGRYPGADREKLLYTLSGQYMDIGSILM